MTYTPWTLELWGIMFRGKDGRETLIGRMWHDLTPVPYDGEPMRALLFTTRKAARDWCRDKHTELTGRTDCCSEWRFRPERVLETVSRTKEKQ